MKKMIFIIIITIALVVLVGFTVWRLSLPTAEAPVVTNFAECVAAGYPVTESYPRQCRTDDQTFTEELTEVISYKDLIKLETPRSGETITSPLLISGEARGPWYFEATFPVMLVNWDGLIIAEGYVTAQDDWMTEGFVPFEGILGFTVDPEVYSLNGNLILQKANPSGLPERDDALEIPIIFTEG